MYSLPAVRLLLTFVDYSRGTNAVEALRYCESYFVKMDRSVAESCSTFDDFLASFSASCSICFRGEASVMVLSSTLDSVGFSNCGSRFVDSVLMVRPLLGIGPLII
jgi:hypothetical protein